MIYCKIQYEKMKNKLTIIIVPITADYTYFLTNLYSYQSKLICIRCLFFFFNQRFDKNLTISRQSL